MPYTLLLAAASAPLLVAYVVLCFRDPLRYALPPYAVLIQFSSLISVGPGPFGSVSSLVGLLLGASLLVQLATTRRGSPRLTLAVPVWLAFLTFCGLSLFWSIDVGSTLEDFTVLASQVLLFVVLALTRFDATAMRRFENAIVVGGVLVVGYGIAQLLFLGGLPVNNGGAGRFGDDLLGANNQAASLLLPIAIIAWRTLTGPRSWRLLRAAVTMTLLFGVVMTGSRGGLVASVVLLATFLFLGAVRRTTAVALVGAATALLAVILVANPAGVGERQVSRGESSSGRTDIWEVGLHACKMYCFAGSGWGTFPVVYRQELAAVPEARVLREGTSYEPHNIFILAVVEAGVLGLLLVVLGLGVALVSALRLPPSMRGPPVAAMVGTLVSSFFLSNLEFKFFWAVLAYVAIASTVAAALPGDDSPGTPAAKRPMAVGKDVR